MRAVLTNTLRPRIGQSQSILSHGSNVRTRKSIVHSVRRKLTFCDAFTILLAPIFTAAFVADITHKDKRRQQWDQKIAEVQQETKAIKENEKNLWRARQLHSVQSGIRSQRRSYSTSASASTSAVNYLDGVESEDLTIDGNSNTTPQPETCPNEFWPDIQSHEKCIAVKLGLQLMLHINTGQDPTGRFPVDQLFEDAVLPDNVDALLKHLAHINTQLRTLAPRLAQHSYVSMETTVRRYLDTHISELARECRMGNIDVHELIYRYTQAVMKSPTGPSLDTYQKFVETLSILDLDAMTSLAMMPYTKSRQILSDSNVFSVIYTYGRLKDFKRLESFTKKLLRPNRAFKSANGWELVTISGTQVPVPINRRPAILDILTRSAFQLDQPHKARAWAIMFLQHEKSSHRIASLFMNFMTYCAVHVNWAYGKLWLQRGIIWGAFLAKEAPQKLQKVIFRMLDLCLACDEVQQYDFILDAAIIAGFDAPAIDDSRPDAFSNKARTIRDDWTSKFKTRAPSYGSNDMIEAATIFQTQMARIHSAVIDFVGVTNIWRLRYMIPYQDVTPRNEPVPELNYLASPDELLTASPLDLEEDGDTDMGILVIKRELANLSEQNSSLLKRNSSFQEEVANLSKQSSNFREEIANLSRQNLSLLEYNSSLREELTDLSEQSSSLLKQNSNVREELHDLQGQNAQLIQANEQLRSQLSKPLPKSLEVVFVKKENLNLRTELRELSSRYLETLNEKKRLQNGDPGLRTHLDRLQKMAIDIDQLRKDNEQLQERLENAEIQSQKNTNAGKARETHLKSILNIKDMRIKGLVADMSKMILGPNDTPGIDKTSMDLKSAK